MMLDQQLTVSVDGMYAFPDYTFPNKPLPQSEIRETVVVRGTTTTSQAAQGTADQKE